MSAVHHVTGLGGRASARPAPQVRTTPKRTANELLVRCLIGSLLAAVAIGVTIAGGYLFAGFVALAALAAAREWHRMVGAERYGREWLATSMAIAAAIASVAMSASMVWPAAFLVAGALVAAAFGRLRGSHAVWSGLGALYIGAPACALVALRVHGAHAEWIVLGVFLVIWSADTGALAVGRIFGGPKLIPSLSPSKTWSGLIGGLAVPAAVAAVYVTAFGGDPLRAGLIGLVLAAAGHSGDLRVLGETPRWPQGQRRVHSWTWRRARPSGFDVVCGAAGGDPRLRHRRLATPRSARVNFASSRQLAALDLAGLTARRLTILGSTGSIGLSTLDIVRHARAAHGPEAMPIEALTARDKVDVLAEQAREFRPRIAVIGNEKLLPRLKEALAGTGIETAGGTDAVTEAAARPSDVVMVGIIGAAALAPTLAAVKRGATIALANKECIVAAGDIFRDALSRSRAVVIPVDSEHNAAFQVLDFAQSHAVDRVTLTASGGPFRSWSRERMEKATPEEAVAHPNWSMGAKISVDSATLMNKGLELIEAHFLFAMPAEQLGVIVHPQSIIHCLVYYADGSTLAHLSAPDMRTPISYALSWPQRAQSPSKRLDLAAIGQLTFEEPDIARFPCLGVAQDCLRAGGLAPTIMNAANEVAVEAFLARRIGFLDIARVIAETLADRRASSSNASDIEGIMAVDRLARDIAGETCRRVAA